MADEDEDSELRRALQVSAEECRAKPKGTTWPGRLHTEWSDAASIQVGADLRHYPRESEMSIRRQGDGPHSQLKPSETGGAGRVAHKPSRPHAHEADPAGAASISQGIPVRRYEPRGATGFFGSRSATAGTGAATGATRTPRTAPYLPGAACGSGGGVIGVVGGIRAEDGGGADGVGLDEEGRELLSLLLTSGPDAGGAPRAGPLRWPELGYVAERDAGHVS